MRERSWRKLVRGSPQTREEMKRAGISSEEELFERFHELQRVWIEHLDREIFEARARLLSRPSLEVPGWPTGFADGWDVVPPWPGLLTVPGPSGELLRATHAWWSGVLNSGARTGRA
jgi:hypothetical protein